MPAQCCQNWLHHQQQEHSMTLTTIKHACTSILGVSYLMKPLLHLLQCCLCCLTSCLVPLQTFATQGSCYCKAFKAVCRDLQCKHAYPSFSHSPTHSFTQSLTHSLIHSLIHALIHSRTHSFTHSLTHSFIHSLIHSLTHS